MDLNGPTRKALPELFGTPTNCYAWASDEGFAVKQTDPQFKMRLPPALKETLEKAAESASRTLSAEIIRRLEWSIAAGEDFTVYEHERKERSKLSMRRLVDPNFGDGSEVQKRLKALEDDVAALKKKLGS